MFHCFVRLLFQCWFHPLVADVEQTHRQERGENGGGEETVLDIILSCFGAEAYKRWTKCAASITSKCQEGKERCATLGDSCRSDADTAWPHDAYSKATNHAASQTDERQRGE